MIVFGADKNLGNISLQIILSRLSITIINEIYFSQINITLNDTLKQLIQKVIDDIKALKVSISSEIDFIQILFLEEQEDLLEENKALISKVTSSLQFTINNYQLVATENVASSNFTQAIITYINLLQSLGIMT